MNNNEAKRVILEADSCFCKHGAYKDCHSGCKYREALDAAVKALEQAKWKPFDSTIPLEDGDYLVTYEDPQTHKLEVLIARYHMAEHEEDECRFYDDTEVEITLAVKAWQPLPEPYMEDD